MKLRDYGQHFLYNAKIFDIIATLAITDGITENQSRLWTNLSLLWTVMAIINSLAVVNLIDGKRIGLPLSPLKDFWGNPLCYCSDNQGKFEEPVK